MEQPDFSTWCKHPATAIRWRVRTDGTGCWVRQCLTCGSQAGPQLSGKSKEVLALTKKTPFDTALQERYDERRKAHWQTQQEAERQADLQKRREWWAWYNEYLKSPEWRARRKMVLQRARNMCEGCKSKLATQVHHLSYEHVGDELLFELVAVCDECHRKLHPDKAKA